MPVSPWQFTIDAAGVSQLLRRDIYTRDDVYLRELLQNAFDSSAEAVTMEFIVSPDAADEVWGVRCCDDGTGMTEGDLRTRFLNLCARKEPDRPQFARFGIGVFTYLSQAKLAAVSTTPQAGGGGSFITLTKPASEANIDSIIVSEPVRLKSRKRGTNVMLLLDGSRPLPDLLGSIGHWIRATLPGKLNLRVKTQKEISSDDTEALRRITCAATSKSGRSISPPLPVPDAFCVPLPKGPPITEGFLSFSPGQSAIILCQDGVLIEENCLDLLPPAYRAVGFSGLVSVNRGLLEIDAGRGKLRNTSQLTALRNQIEPACRAAIQRYLESRPLSVSSAPGALQTSFTTFLGAMPTAAAADFVRLLSRYIIFPGFESRRTWSLESLAAYARGQGVVYYLDGDPSQSWGWNRSVGQLAGYSAEIRIPESESALAVAQRSTVFYLPRKSNPNESLFPLAVLQAFFAMMGVRLLDAGTASDAIAPASPPAEWSSKLTLPGNFRVAELAAGRTVAIAYDMTASCDLRREPLATINRVLATRPELENDFRSVAEAYLNFVSGNLSEGLSLLASAVRIMAEKKYLRQGSVAFQDVLQEIRGGQ